MQWMIVNEMKRLDTFILTDSYHQHSDVCRFIEYSLNNCD